MERPSDPAGHRGDLKITRAHASRAGEDGSSVCVGPWAWLSSAPHTCLLEELAPPPTRSSAETSYGSPGALCQSLSPTAAWPRGRRPWGFLWAWAALPRGSCGSGFSVQLQDPEWPCPEVWPPFRASFPGWGPRAGSLPALGEGGGREGGRGVPFDLGTTLTLVAWTPWLGLTCSPTAHLSPLPPGLLPRAGHSRGDGALAHTEGLLCTCMQ